MPIEMVNGNVRDNSDLRLEPLHPFKLEAADLGHQHSLRGRGVCRLNERHLEAARQGVAANLSVETCGLQHRRGKEDGRCLPISPGDPHNRRPADPPGDLDLRQHRLPAFDGRLQYWRAHRHPRAWHNQFRPLDAGVSRLAHAAVDAQRTQSI
jgi:hypothetical protein